MITSNNKGAYMKLQKQFENHVEYTELLEQINEVEAKITIYSDRDRLRTKQLEVQLHELNMQLLDLMVIDDALRAS